MIYAVVCFALAAAFVLHPVNAGPVLVPALLCALAMQSLATRQLKRRLARRKPPAGRVPVP